MGYAAVERETRRRAIGLRRPRLIRYRIDTDAAPQRSAVTARVSAFLFSSSSLALCFCATDTTRVATSLNATPCVPAVTAHACKNSSKRIFPSLAAATPDWR